MQNQYNMIIDIMQKEFVFHHSWIQRICAHIKTILTDEQTSRQTDDQMPDTKLLHKLDWFFFFFWWGGGVQSV